MRYDFENPIVLGSLLCVTGTVERNYTVVGMNLDDNCFIVNILCFVHGLTMILEYFQTGLLIRLRNLNLTIESTGSE